MFLRFLTLFGAIGLACSEPTNDPSDLPTTKALRCVVECLNVTQRRGEANSYYQDDVVFVNCLSRCESADRNFSFVKWFLEKRPHDDWVIPLATTTSSAPSTTSPSLPTTKPPIGTRLPAATRSPVKTRTPNTAMPASTRSPARTSSSVSATTSRPQIFGAQRILKKYCDVLGNPKGPKTDNFFYIFNDVWTQIQVDLDNAVGQEWNPAHNEEEFCKLYDEKFLSRAKETAVNELVKRGTTKPSSNDVANDVLDYLDRSVRLAYFVNHFTHFENTPLPDT